MSAWLLEPERHANGYRDSTEAIRREVVFIGVDLFLLPKETVGKLALAWG